MWLSEVQLQAALYAVRDVVSRRVLGGQPVRKEVRDLYERLLAASTGGTENEGAVEESTPEDLIGTEEAAAMLGCSTHWVRRVHADLDGQKSGGRWVFRRPTVNEYANRKCGDRDANRVPPTWGRAVSP